MENKNQQAQETPETVQETKSFSEILISYNKAFGSNVLKPSHDLLCHLPGQMTAFKRHYILETATVNVRLIALAFSTLAVSMISLRAHRSVVSAFRNTIIGYFGLGTFLAPEIFNPFLQFGALKK